MRLVSLVGVVGLLGLLGLVSLIGWVGLEGPVGLVSLVGLVGILGLLSPVGHVVLVGRLFLWACGLDESAWHGGFDWSGVPSWANCGYFSCWSKVFSNRNIFFYDSKEFDDPQVSHSLKVFSFAFKVVCSTNKSSCH